MSDSHAQPAQTLDALKAHAKQLLSLARAHDTTVIMALRKLLPKLAGNSDTEFVANIKLADVQHAIATQRGIKSWAELKRRIELVNPIQLQAERFLHATREDDKALALQLLFAHPKIAQYSIHAAAAACDATSVEAFLLHDRTLAIAPASPNNAQPVLYACGTPLHDVSEAQTSGNERCMHLLLDAGADPNAFIQLTNPESDAPLSALYFAANLNNRTPTLEQHPLYFIAGHKPFSKWCGSSELGMQWLLQHGANPNIPSYNTVEHAALPTRGETPLHRII